MDVLISAKVAAIFLLILGNAFFVASEIALTSARRSRIAQLASEGDGSARIVQMLHANPERFYSVTQIGITLMSLALGAIGIATFTEVIDPPMVRGLAHLSFLGAEFTSESVAHTVAQVLAFLLVSTLHIVGGELAPKVYAFHKPEALSLSVARLINLLYRLFRWFIWLLNHMSNGLLRLFGQRDLTGPGGGHFSISEEELRTILVASESAGVLGAAETAMIRGVFDLEKHTAGEVMTPRNLVVGIPAEATIDQALDIFRTDRHHRYPVYEGSLDRVVGILSIKELLNHIDLSDGASARPQSIKDLMLPAYPIPETMTLKTLLKEFRAKRQQMATVIDEFGGNAGAGHAGRRAGRNRRRIRRRVFAAGEIAARQKGRRSPADRPAHPHRRIHRSGRCADSARRLHHAVRVHLSAARAHSGTEGPHRSARVRADRRPARRAAHRADQLHIDETRR